MVVLVVVAETFGVVVDGVETWRHRRILPTKVHLKVELPMLRILPAVLQVLPSIDFGFTESETATLATNWGDSGSETEIGRIPVSTAAPIEAPWHTMHIGALNGTH